MGPEQGPFTEAMGQVAAGVAVVTVKDDRDDLGTTVATLMSVSLDPPLVLISLASAGYLAEVLLRRDRWAASVLADGQQGVVLGIHPDVRREYFYPHDHILDVEVQDLPLLTAEKAAQIVNRAQKMLFLAGGEPRSRAGGKIQSKAKADWKPGPPPRQVKGMDEAELVIAALRRIEPIDLDYDIWIRVAYGLKAAFGDTAADIWEAWSKNEDKNPKNVAQTTQQTWRWVRPTRAGWRYLIRLADNLDAG